ncbi:hypothetical protein J6590_035300 [Homalodisca vitripennis]|nr:hypothetical protein J6590_035300 [Homalodisca vitripennis]
MRVDRCAVCLVTTHRLAHIAGQGSHLSVTQHACCSQGLPERVRPTLPSGIQQTMNATERPGCRHARTHSILTSVKGDSLAPAVSRLGYSVTSYTYN